ncbi:hypothetical protein G6O69_30130 [Pseudenhygromyxa sp. WMMC2535]|uniref:hypothetical protein n=1 Tax=Pseudenhygromyxa sp. WMMC2535 TaxID=2712867 RepID=UPI00155315BA|nr:hypothetical protein [Pseudenhygromyxa sp. WMMC2535]NVB42120.1 hypothetical protein [Pseudenhygromyxa sp. WMMC2535]
MPKDNAQARKPSLQRTTAALIQPDGALRWAPIIAALAIDLADLATAGPLGLAMGIFVGGTLTTVVAAAGGARLGRALLLGVLGAIYCALPLTEALPMATLLTMVHAFAQRKAAREQAREEDGAADSSQDSAPLGVRVVQAGPAQR